MQTFKLTRTFSAVIVMFDNEGNDLGEQDGRFEAGQEFRAKFLAKNYNEVGNPLLTIELPMGYIVDLPEHAVVVVG